MKERILTGIALIAAFVFAILQSSEILNILIYAIVVIAGYEIYSARKLDSKKYVLIFPVILVALAGVIDYHHVTTLIGITIMLMFTLAVFDESFTYDLVAYYVTMITILIVALSSVTEVLSYGKLVFLYVLVATYATDTFALFGGKFFGKHKLIERISPKKTIEGAVVGYICSVILSITFAFLFIDNLPKVVIVIASLLMPVLSQIGDLAFSLIKRKFGIKDFGKIFPGHGGVLDRIDSLIFALITFIAVTQVYLFF